jgi:hypothetical protein
MVGNKPITTWNMKSAQMGALLFENMWVSATGKRDGYHIEDPGQIPAACGWTGWNLA